MDFMIMRECLLYFTMCLTSFLDAKSREIPNGVSLPLLMISVVLTIINPSAMSIDYFILLIFLLVQTYTKLLGGGDFKILFSYLLLASDIRHLFLSLILSELISALMIELEFKKPPLLTIYSVVYGMILIFMRI